MLKKIMLSSAAASALAATPANAAISFALDYPSSTSRDLTFTIPDNFTTFGVTPNQFSLTAYVTYGNGVSQFETMRFIAGGAFTFQITSNLNYTYAGPVLFSGPTTAPVFVDGTYNLDRSYTGSISTLVINSVPEPTSWALMIAGVGVLGGAIRRRSHTVQPAFA